MADDKDLPSSPHLTAPHLTAFVDRVAPHISKRLVFSKAPDPVLEAMTNALFDPLYLKDLNGHVLACNEAACRAVGLSASKIVGTNPDYILSNEGQRTAREAEQQAIATGQRVVVDVSLRAVGQEQQTICRMTKHPVFAADGSVVAVLCHSVDRTDQILAERKLCAMSEIVHNSNDAIYSRTLDGIVLNWNKGAEKIYGWSAEEMVGSNVDKLGENVAGEVAQLTEVIRVGGAVTNHETVRMRRDGSRFDISLSICPLYDQEERCVVGASVIGRDLSGQKQVERLVAGAQSEACAQEANMSRFLASASHDLRQPLQAMFLYVSALAPFVTEPGHAAFKSLSISLEAMKSLLDGLLDISSLDSELIHPAVEEFAIGEILRPLRSAMEPLASKKGLHFYLLQSDVIVRTDRKLLARVLTNLAHNAIAYTIKGRVLIQCHEHGNKLSIEVQDTGIGIAESQHRAVFDEFVQIGNQQRDRTRGIGLGLSVVRRIAKILDHRISLTSTPGAGSTFSIEVPLVGKITELPGKVAPPLSHLTFAVVIDDDVFLRDAFKMIFSDMNYDAVIAASTDEAMSLLTAERPPDVMVLDYRLIGETGLDACKRVRGLYRRHIPGILLTGDIGNHIEACAANAGLTLIHKPITTASLGDALDEVMGREAAREGGEG